MAPSPLNQPENISKRIDKFIGSAILVKRMWQKASFLAVLLLIGNVALASNDLSIGFPAPEINNRTVDGKVFKLSSQLGEKGTILLFFTSWSKSSQPAINTLLKLSDQSGINSCGISFDRKIEDLKSYLTNNKISFPIINDKKLALLKDYRILIIPTIYLLDGAGNIVNIYVDFDDNVAQTLEKEVQGLITPTRSAAQ
jgi:peroxiredoxin